MADWIDELPEEVREIVKNNTKDLVDSRSGEWVPSSKISELTQKHNQTKQELEASLEQAKKNLEQAGTNNVQLEETKAALEQAKKDLEDFKSDKEFSDKLRQAGAEYPDLFLKEKGTDIEELKKKYPKYFIQQSTSSQKSGDGEGKKLTPEELRTQELNKLKEKPQKTQSDYARIFSLMNKKE